MKKALITGANGLLGQALIRTFRKDYQTVGCDLADTYFDSERPPAEYLKLDITRRNDVLRVCGDLRPDIILNAAAFTDVDESEKDRERCWNVNVRGVEFLEEVCKLHNMLFVQLSTDYVFDGTAGPYAETDEPKPLGYYGLTKLSSEKVIRSGGMEYIIARTMILYGTGVSVRPNFALWVVEQLQKGQKIKIVNDQIGNPTLVDDLAISLYKLIEAEEYGLFHIAGNETCTRYDFAQKIANVFNLNNKPIEEITTDQLGQQAKRPMNSTFILNKLHNTIDWLPGNLDVSLQKLKVQMGL